MPKAFLLNKRLNSFTQSLLCGFFSASSSFVFCLTIIQSELRTYVRYGLEWRLLIGGAQRQPTNHSVASQTSLSRGVEASSKAKAFQPDTFTRKAEFKVGL